MAKYLLSIFAIFTLAFSSCQSLEQISIEYIRPADVTFPNSLRRVAIVNNAIEEHEYNWTISEKPTGFNQTFYATSYPNVHNQLATESLAKAIANQNYFDEVLICDSALRANDKFMRESTLSQSEVQELTEKLDVDCLISFENAPMKATKQIYYEPEWSHYRGTIDLKIYPTFKVYLPSRKRPMLSLTSNDSIFWDQFGSTDIYVKAHLLSDSQIIQEASEFIGSMPIKSLLPHWITANRYIYTNGSVNMRDATIYVRENAWEKAFKLWDEEYAKVKSNKKKMCIAFNLAIYHEIRNDLKQAEIWALKAQEFALKVDKIDLKNTKDRNLEQSPNYIMISLFLTNLQDRKAELSKLNIQMSRFNDDF